MAFPSMWARPLMTPSEWTRKRTSNGWLRYYSAEIADSRVGYRIYLLLGVAAPCARLHASAAATRLEMAGCEGKSNSIHFEGVLSARFCLPSLVLADMKGSRLAIDSKAYRSPCRSLKRE